MYSSETKFKIGDLVKIVKSTNFIGSNEDIEVGDVGLVVHLFPDDKQQMTLWGIDYTVLIKGKRLLFFDDELELVESQNKLASQLQFIYLKHKVGEIKDGSS